MEPEKRPVKYQLTVTKEQAEIISLSVEMYARLRMGQIRNVLSDGLPERFSWDKADTVVEEFRKNLFPELIPNQSYGVRHEEKIDEAVDIYEVIRHQLAWDRVRDSGRESPEFHGCHYDEPFHWSKSPLPEIARIEVDTDTEH